MPKLNDQTLKALGLLYEKSYLASQLTADPSVGELDIQALVDDKERCFRTFDKTKHEAKKTIILSSWYFQELKNPSTGMRTDETYQSLIECFSDLILQGFTVYVPNESGLTKINDKASLIIALDHLSPLSTDAARKMAAQLHLSKDHTDIFNLQRIKAFLNTLTDLKIEPYAKTIRSTDRKPDIDIDITTRHNAFIEPQDKLHLSEGERTKELSKKTKRHIYSIAYKKNSKDAQPYLEHDYIETPNLKSLTLDGAVNSQALEAFFKKKIPLEEIIIGPFNSITYAAKAPLMLSQDQLPHLTKLKIQIVQPAEQAIFSIIQAASNLKSIEIRNDRFQQVAPIQLPLKKCQLEHLTQLSWHGDGINDEQLSTFLHAAPNLKELMIGSSCMLGTAALHLLPNELPHLSKFSTNVCSINAAQLHEILLAAPNLKEISLHLTQNIGDFLLKIKPNKALTTFTLSHSPLTYPQLSALIAATPNLETINIKGSPLRGDLSSLIIPTGALKKLKTLRTPKISLTALDKLLKSTPQLKTLDIEKLERAPTPDKNQLSLTPGQLSDVEEIKGELNINSDQLITLLLAAPNVESLNLSESHIETSAVQAPNLQLKNLKLLNLAEAHICAPDLSLLFKLTPEIESLNLSGCKYFGQESFGLTKNQLKSLKKIDLEKAQCTTQELSELLNAAPHIEHLNLTKCSIFNNGNLIIEEQLKQLTTLNINQSNITGDDFFRLIAMAPNLVSINFSECNLLNSTDVAIKPIELNHLITLNASHAILTIEQLATLIKAAPHLKSINLSYSNLVGCQSYDLESERLNQWTQLPYDDLVSTLTDFSERFTKNQAPRHSTTYTHQPAQDSKTPLPKANKRQTYQEESVYKNKTLVSSKGSHGIQSQFSNLMASMPMISSAEPSQPKEAAIGPHTASTIDGKLKSNPSKTIKAHQLFQGHVSHPKTESYHLQSSQWGAPCTFVIHSPKPEALKSVAAIQLHSSSDIEKNFKENPSYQSKDHYFGQIKLGSLTPGVWYQLPALSTHDQLKCFATRIKNAEIKLDEESGYHYLCVKEPITSGVLHYIIESKPSSPRPPMAVDLKIMRQLNALQFDQQGRLIPPLEPVDKGTLTQALIEFCSFPEESSENTLGSSIEILNHLIKTRAGACRHRAMLFVAMATALEIKVSLIENDSHAFVTVNENGFNQSIDLGGAEAQVQEIEMQPIKEEEEAEPSPKKPQDPPLAVAEATTQEEEEAPIEPEVATLPLPTETPQVKEKKEQPAIQQPKQPVIPALEPSSENPFKTWDNLPLHGEDWASIAVEMTTIAPPIARHLLILDDEAAIEALHAAVLDTRQPVFFTDNLDNLSLHTLKTNEGSYDRVASPLAIFLNEATTHPLNTMTWYINWSNPKDDQVGLNSLIDDLDRRLGTLPLPPNLHIVVVMDRDSAGLMGEDFYSRFDGISQVHPFTTALPNEPKKEPEMPVKPNDALITSPAKWKKVLLGSYHMDGQTLSFEPGALIKAILNKSDTLQIHNAPWDNPEFRWFMTHLLKERRVFMNGQDYFLPETLTITCSQPLYDYSEAITPPVAKQSPLGWLYRSTMSLLKPSASAPKAERLRQSRLINAETYDYLFPHHRVSPTEGVKLCKGWLEPDAHLNLIVTHPLDEAEWYTLWTEAQKNHCDIKIQCAPHVTVPDPLQKWVTQTAPIQPQGLITLDVSNDLDFAIAAYPEALVIPVGPDTRFEQLFCHFHRQEQNFTCQKTMLLEAIEKGQPVVFKGEFTNELARRLQTLFTNEPSLYVNGETIVIHSPIHLITTNETAFEGILHQKINYDPSRDFEKLEPSLQARLRALYLKLNIEPCHSHFLNLAEDKATHESFVEALSQNLSLSQGLFVHPENPTSPEAVLSYLKEHPFVFLLSETGAGKSYFVERVLKDHNPSLHIHHGLEKLKAWAESDGLLFLDEANLAAEHFHVFDNLARGERSIWIEGQYYHLSPEHHVIFAGNPKQYEGRFESDLLKRFPYYLEFKGQRLDNILSPLLESFENKEHLIHIINTYYQKALDAGLNITPRNAQMMCLNAFILKQLPNTHALPDDFLIQYAVLKEIENLNTSLKLTDELEDKGLTNIEAARTSQLPPLTDADFIWTKSRIKTALAIQALLSIRQSKIEGTFDQALGINGVVLEGSPGLGKSRLLHALLQGQKASYTIISTTHPDDMRRQLLKAFNEGQVALIDELNSFPDEQLLNALLSGTDLDGNPPKKPGFCLLATQNPMTYQGRQSLSKALSNRLLTLNLEHYESGELEDILQKKFMLSKTKTTQLISEYNTSRQYAEQQGLFPPPNPRILFKEAEQEKNKAPKP